MNAQEQFVLWCLGAFGDPGDDEEVRNDMVRDAAADWEIGVNGEDAWDWGRAQWAYESVTLWYQTLSFHEQMEMPRLLWLAAADGDDTP